MNSQVVPEHRPRIDTHTILGLIGLILLALFLIGVLIVLNLDTWGKPVAIVLGVIVAVPVGWKIFITGHTRYMEHHTIKQTHEHAKTQRLLAQQALSMGHSVEMKHTDHLGGIHEFRSVSPLTIPNAPVTIKELNYGQQALLEPGTQYPIAPPFASVKSLIRPGRLVLGYNTQGPIIGDVSDLLSMAFVGKPGTGKSTGLLYYLAILLLVDASVFVFDHQGSLSEVADLIPYYGEFSEIYGVLPEIYAEIEEREEMWRHGKQVKKPLLLLVDELPGLARYEAKTKPAESVLDLAEKIVIENRKHNCYCMLTGTSLPANVLPTLTRDNLSSRLVFNSSDMHARMAGLDEASRKKLLPLLRKAQPGTAILDVSRRPEPDITALPFTTVDDLRTIIDSNLDSVPGSGTGTAGTAFLSVSPEEREQIIELAKAGIPRREMCLALGKGKYYYDTVKQVLDEEGL